MTHDPLPHDPAASRDFHRERLSAMLDGALSADETRFLLRRMQHDDELADSWQRWQFYGDALRGEAGRALPSDFAHRVGRAIADDQARAAAAPAESPVAAVAAVATRRPLLRWGGGAALAASVALAAVLVGRGPAVPDAEVPPMPAVALAGDAPLAQPPVPAPVSPAGQDGNQEAFVLAAAAVAAASATAAESRNSRPRIMAADRTEATVATAPTAVAAVAAPPARDARGSRTLSRRPATTVVADAGNARGIAADARIVAKPWPRSLVPGAGQAGGGVMAGYDDGPALPPILRPTPMQEAAPRFEAPQSPPTQATETAPGSP